MKLYQVTYATNNYSSDRKLVHIVANNAVNAAQEVGKKKYTSYGGYVTAVVESVETVYIAK